MLSNRLIWFTVIVMQSKEPASKGVGCRGVTHQKVIANTPSLLIALLPLSKDNASPDAPESFFSELREDVNNN